ncbi:DUF2268 domain-containing putative Zn-dependent protease, partial [Bacillus vallismortis]|nr:DUF2268 domain-containing putative Zn-dependent protease [Bacillus vallismortis]
QGYEPAGFSAFAGYAVGYHAVQSFMAQHQVTISEATLLVAETILSHCGLFGYCKSVTCEVHPIF